MASNAILVVFAPTATAARIAALARVERLSQRESARLQLLGETVVRFRLPRGRSVRQEILRLGRQSAVAFAQPDYLYALAKSNVSPPARTAAVSPAADPLPQYAIEKLEVLKAHDEALGRGVSIAVIDSAVDLRNPAFKDSRIESFDALGAPQPPQAHGTGMVGAIAATRRIVGVAPAAKILAITAFASSGGSSASGETWAILKALDIAAANKARIVNMSFAGPPDPLLSKAIAAGERRDMIFVAAAGNGGPKAAALYPAADAGVIAVGATDDRDRPYRHENRGRYVAVAAPGVDVLVPAPGGYDMSTGTSVAAALVSGVTALLVELREKLDARQAEAALVKSAARPGAPARPEGVAPGPVDALRALAAIGVAEPTEASGPGENEQPGGTAAHR